jgi:hypothetical protein
LGYIFLNLRDLNKEWGDRMIDANQVTVERRSGDDRRNGNDRRTDVDRRVGWGRRRTDIPPESWDDGKYLQPVVAALNNQVSNSLTIILGYAELLLNNTSGLTEDQANKLRKIISHSIKIRETMRRASKAGFLSDIKSSVS